MVSSLGRPKTVLDPTSMLCAAVYAEAMVGLVSEDAEAESLYEEMAALLALLDGEPEFERLLTAAVVGDQEREGVVRTTFSGRVSEKMASLLAVMARHGRMNLLRAVVQTYRRLLNERQGKIEVRVTTAVALDEEQKRQLEQTVREALKREPLLALKVDESLLGGVVLRIGDRRYDASVATQLKRLRDQIGKKKSIIA
jgi:F-type H+-transporting ATPase subunit delta